MTTEQLNSYLANPAAMSVEDLKIIGEYRNEYPYSPVFAALHAKALHNLKDLKYDVALREAAILLPDRGVLYQLIYKEPLQKKIIEVQKTIEEEEVVELEESVERQEVTKTPTVDSDESQELERDIIIEAINTSIQLDVDQLLEEEVPDSIDEWKEEKKAEKTTEVVEEKVPSKFSDWLFAMKTPSQGGKEEEKNEEDPLMSSTQLIDRFIKTKPRKIDISKEPVSPQEMGKLSLVEDEGFVTETLAEIYAKQGKYQKAIKIYEQLSLNNPEKKVFFASRIRFLREKLEYDK